MSNAYAGQRSLAEKYIPGGQLVDVSAASISYAACPAQGVIVDALCCISAAVTSADSIVTLKKKAGGATAVTLGTITVAYTGSAIGQVFTAVMTGTEADRSVAKGDTLICDSDGVSSTTSIANFTWVIRET